MATILCVEDEPGLRADLAEELECLGHDVLQAEDGAAGLELVVAHRPDLVISDITMPRMNGFEFLEKLRHDHPELAEMPFLFLSALSDREDVLAGIRKGGDDYLTKPVDYDMLTARVGSALRQSMRFREKKTTEQIKLFKALNKKAGRPQPATPAPARRAARPLNIVLVGRGDEDMWQLQQTLKDMGHRFMLFTSGRVYCEKAAGIKADITFIGLHSDDYQAGFTARSVAADKDARTGPVILLLPESLKGSINQPLNDAMTDVMEMPVASGTLAEKIGVWRQQAAEAALAGKRTA